MFVPQVVIDIFKTSSSTNYRDIPATIMMDFKNREVFFVCDKFFTSIVLKLKLLSFIGNTSDGLFVQHQLKDGNATKLLIDIFKASSIAKYIEIPTIMLDEVIDVSASYGVLLSGELISVSRCVKKYVEERNDVFLQQLSDSVVGFQVALLSIYPSKNDILIQPQIHCIVQDAQNFLR